MSNTPKYKKSFVLRIYPEMMEIIEKWAADESRSTNGQIEFLLSKALKKTKDFQTKMEKTNQLLHRFSL